MWKKIYFSVSNVIWSSITLGLTVEGIFRIPGDAGAIKSFRKELDRGMSSDRRLSAVALILNLSLGKASKFDKVTDPHLAAGILKSFLIDMDEPLFTYEISDSFLKATGKCPASAWSIGKSRFFSIIYDSFCSFVWSEIADTFLQHECLRQALEQLPPGHKVITEVKLVS